MRILKKKEKKVVATILTAVMIMSVATVMMPATLWEVKASEAVADEDTSDAADTSDTADASDADSQEDATGVDVDVQSDVVPSADASSEEAQQEPATTTVNPNGEIKTTLVDEGKSGGYTPKSTGNTLMTVTKETDVKNSPGDDGVVLYTYRAGDAVVVCGQQTKGCMPVIFRGQIGYVDSANLTSAYVDYKQLANEIEFVNENTVSEAAQEDTDTDASQSSHVWMIILIIIVVILGAVGVAAAVYAIRKL